MNLSKQPITPRKILNVQGKLHYNESNQAGNKLKFKKELLDEFPQLKEKRSKFSYKLMFIRDYDSFSEIAQNMKNENVMPIMMWIYKEE